MTLDKCIQSIDHYLANKNEVQPRLVNVENCEMLNTLRRHYLVEGNAFISVPVHSRKDEKLCSEELIDDLVNRRGNVFLIGITSFWKLEGEKTLRKKLNELLHIEVAGHLVVLCYQCRKYLKFGDSRIKRLIYDVTEGSVSSSSKVVFMNSESLALQNNNVVIGIENLPEYIEKVTNDKIIVITNKRKRDFPYSLYQISEEINAYQILLKQDIMTGILPETLGTNEQWTYALQLMKNDKTWDTIIDEEIGPCKN